MIKEVVIVEGMHDVQAVQRAVDAECIATGGFNLLPPTVEKIAQAYERRGIIILTDPDSAGERIRRYLVRRFPGAKHAFVPQEEALANGDIGIEEAASESIRAALAKARCQEWRPELNFSMQDMVAARLNGFPDAAQRRAAVGARLGIGYANAKNFLYRLNHYGVTRGEWEAAVRQLEGEK